MSVLPQIEDEPTVIFDANGLLHHAYNAAKNSEFPEHENDGSETPSARDGLAAFMDKFLAHALDLVPGRRIFAVWDGGSEYRKQIFSGYKEKRHAKREEDAAKEPVKFAQMAILKEKMKETLSAIGACQLELGGVEGDDVIAYLVQKLPEQKVIYTTDADMLVLSGPNVSVFLKDVLYQGDEYKGIPVHLLTLYKSLVGDTSDEYKGVHGFGPGAWDKYVEEFGIDGMEELDSYVKAGRLVAFKRLAESENHPLLLKLVNSLSSWAQSYNLAALHPELCEQVTRRGPVEIQWNKSLPDTNKFRELLEFARLETVGGVFRTNLRYDRLVTSENFDKFLSHFKSTLGETPLIAFDYESYDSENIESFREVNKKYVDVLSQKITGCSFTYGKNLSLTAYVSVGHKDTDNVPIERLKEVFGAVKEAGKRLVAQNKSFETTLTRTNLDLDLEEQEPADTKLMIRYIDENGQSGLKALSKRFLRYIQTTYAETVGDHSGMNELTGEEVLTYGCDDAICTAHLCDLFNTFLLLEGSRDRVMDAGMASTGVLTDAFIDGVRIDFDELSRLQAVDAETVEVSNAKISELLGEHCALENKEAAEAFYNVVKPFIEAAARYTAESKEIKNPDGFVEAKLGAAYDKILDGSRYVPPVEVPVSVPAFIPSVVQINKLITACGIETPIEKASSRGITEWVLGLPELEGEKARCVELLSTAAHQFKARAGAEYGELVNFRDEVIGRDLGTEIVGDTINFGSPVHLQMLLYAKMGLPVRNFSKVDFGSLRDKLGFEEGSPSTDESAIRTALALDIPEESDWRREVLIAVLALKKAQTRDSIYYKPYPLWKREDDERPGAGVIHPSVIDCGTDTRRPTSSSPNILQVSKRDEVGLRRAFLPRRDDHVIISPDFSGQELRILASECKDPVLLDAYLGEVKKDIHTVTATGFAKMVADRFVADALAEEAARLLSVYETFKAAIDSHDDSAIAVAAKKLRQIAKTVNFLIIYGGGPTKLAKELLLALETAKSIMQSVFNKYARIQPWKDEVIEFARTHGYVETAFGTRRHAPTNLWSKDNGLSGRVERQLVNAVIQGCAAEILKEVLKDVGRQKLLRRYKGTLIAPVYDEFTASVPRDAAVDYSMELAEIMRVTPPGHAVPMVPELSIGKDNWRDMQELGADFTEETILAAIA